jgi:hypothetical protein
MVGKSRAVKRESIDTGNNKRYLLRNRKDRFDEANNVGRSLSRDVKGEAGAIIPARQDTGVPKRKWVEPSIVLIEDKMMGAAKKKENDNGIKRRTKRVSRKDQIIALYLSGMNEVEDLAIITGARASYVGSVLQESGLVRDYFDLYTSTAHPMNVYSKFFANKLGFKDEAKARASVELIDQLYHQFEFAQDRAGQHHALSMALVMFDRARWTGKGSEADIFRQWLLARLNEAELAEDDEAGAQDDKDLGD